MERCKRDLLSCFAVEKDLVYSALFKADIVLCSINIFTLLFDCFNLTCIDLLFIYLYFTYVDVLCEDVFILYSLKTRGLCNSVEEKPLFFFVKQRCTLCIITRNTF